MDSSQSAITPQREKILWAILLLILGVWACFSYTNWISDSEFWPVTLAGHWEEWRGNPALIYKAVFHGTLSWIYFFDLDSVEHLKVAKAFYSLLGILSFVLFFKIAKSRLDSIRALLLTMLFLFSNFGFSQIGVIRSDFLSFLIFEIALLVLLSQSTGNWKRIGWWNLIFSILIFLTTPKGIYFVFLLAVFSFVRVEKNIRFKLFNMLMGFACVGVTIIFGFSRVNEAFLSALRFAIESKGSTERFWHTPSPIYLKNDVHLILLLGIGWIVQLIQLFKRKLKTNESAWALLAILGLVAVFMHKPALPFFIGSVWGLFYLGILPVLSRLNTLYFMAVVIASLSLFLYKFSQNYYYPNKVQLEAIEAVEESLKTLPNEKLFDGLGTSPRVPQILAYLGPHDRIANINVFLKLIQEKPAIIINTHRMVLIEADVNSFLIENYKSIGIGYWLRKDLEGLTDLNHLKSAFHVFGFYPIPRMLEN